MKFVKQTVLGDKKGNCLSACIASMLEIDINTIPYILDDDTWQVELNKWLLENHGYEVITVRLDEEHLAPKVPMIACGATSRYSPDIKHAVIWHKGKMIFDPSPDNKGLKDEPEYYILLLKDQK